MIKFEKTLIIKHLMNNYYSFLLIFFVTFLTAQDYNHLTLEDAVMGNYKGLYPEQKSIQWVDQSDDYIELEK